jgi:hypothetical protein
MTTFTEARWSTIIQAGRGWPVVMLVSRTLLFAVGQLFIALAYAVQTGVFVWEASIAWWPLTAVFGNLVCLVLLEMLLRREGSSTQVTDGWGDYRLRDIVLQDTVSGKTEAVAAAGLFVLIGAVPHTTWLPHHPAR